MVQTNAFNNTTQTAYTPSATDLINQGQSTFLSSSASAFTALSGSNIGALNNGGVGTANNLPDTAFSSTNPFTVTFTLDTSVYTLGYDITEVQTIAGWQDKRVNQHFTLRVSHVATPTTFVDLGTFTYRPTTATSGNFSSRVTLTNTGGGVLDNGTYSATGVKAVQFVVLVPGGTLEETVFREFDVVGAATIPEPGTAGLAAFALAALFLFSQRRGRGFRR